MAAEEPQTSRCCGLAQRQGVAWPQWPGEGPAQKLPDEESALPPRAIAWEKVLRLCRLVSRAWAGFQAFILGQRSTGSSGPGSETGKVSHGLCLLRASTRGMWVWQRKPFVWGAAVVTTGGSRKELSPSRSAPSNQAQEDVVQSRQIPCVD